MRNILIKILFALSLSFIPFLMLRAEEGVTCSDLTHLDYDMTKGFYHVADIDGEKAVEICSKEQSIKPQDAKLNFLLGRAYRASGEAEKSIFYFKKAYELGHADAAAQIADSYFYGVGGHASSTEKFFEWSKTSHDAGSLHGTLSLALAYKEGSGVTSNWGKAAELMALASKGGLTAATLNIARDFAYGDYGYEQNIEKAKEIWRALKIDGVEQAWLDEAVFKLNQPEDDQDVLNAIAELKRLADLGWNSAQGELAFINMRPENYKFTETAEVKSKLSYSEGLIYGLDVIDTDYFLLNFDDFFFDANVAKKLDGEQISQIIQALETVAHGPEKNTAMMAAQILGRIELYGTIKRPSVEQAVKWFSFAVDNLEDHLSASWLSDIYREEIEVLNPEKAIEYAEFAALNPDPYFYAEALTTLGILYMYNQDQQNLQKANKYFRKADKVVSESEFKSALLYEHLTLLHTLGGEGFKRDIQAAKRFAEEIQKNNGSTFPLYFLTRHDISADTTKDEIKAMLETTFFDGKKEASYILAALAEIDGDIVNQYKWTAICSMLCPDEMKEGYVHHAGVLTKRMGAFEKNKGQSAVNESLAQYYVRSNEKLPTNPETKAKKFQRIGNLYALLIGNAAYEKMPNLETPIKDIRAIGALIEDKYGAINSYVENGSRLEIMRAFKALERTVAENDSVMIFYAGHGKMIQAQNEGYWLPVDAAPDEEFDWISNSYIKSQIQALRAKNILLVADSCFSGLLTRGLDVPNQTTTPTRIEEFQKTASRVVISSGGLEPVLDGFGGENSIFANEFIKLLKEKSQPLTSSELYTAIRDTVAEKSIKIGRKQVPYMATLVSQGHEGPDFVFIPN